MRTTTEKAIEQAWRKVAEYDITVSYGEQREISCDCVDWTIEAVIRTDEDLPDLISAIEARLWPEMCKARAWA